MAVNEARWWVGRTVARDDYRHTQGEVSYRQSFFGLFEVTSYMYLDTHFVSFSFGSLP